MKKALLIVSILFIAAVTTACINNMAVQELNNKAAEYMQKGDYEAAMSRLQASLDLDSSMYETYYNLGIAATNAKKYKEAIAAFESGIKVKPDYADFYYSLGVAQSSFAEALEEATLDEEKDKEDVENNTEVDKEAAKAYKQQAADNLEKYLIMVPDTPEKETIQAIIKDCRDIDDKETVKE